MHHQTVELLIAYHLAWIWAFAWWKAFRTQGTRSAAWAAFAQCLGVAGLVLLSLGLR